MPVVRKKELRVIRRELLASEFRFAPALISHGTTGAEGPAGLGMRHANANRQFTIFEYGEPALRWLPHLPDKRLQYRNRLRRYFDSLPQSALVNVDQGYVATFPDKALCRGKTYSSRATGDQYGFLLETPHGVSSITALHHSVHCAK